MTGKAKMRWAYVATTVVIAGFFGAIAALGQTDARKLAQPPVPGGRGVITVVDTTWVDASHAAIIGCYAALLSPNAPPSPMGCLVLYHVERQQ